MKSKFLVVVEKGGGNYSAYSPDVPGCIATGKTIETVLAEMKSALEFHFEGLIESGEAIPTPKSLNFYVEKTDEISSDDILAHVEIELSELALA